MIDYKKCLEFCSEHQLSANELFLLYTLHIKSEQLMPEIYGKMRDYYSNNKDDRYVDMVRKLNERGFLEILKEPENKNSIDLRYLKITEKFSDLLFADAENVWKSFLDRYPSKGISPDGMEYFSAKIISKDDEEIFKKKILKGVNKMAASELLYVLEDMFDFNYRTKEPEKFAKYGVSRFILNWDTILAEWKKEKEEEEKGNWRTRQV